MTFSKLMIKKLIDEKEAIKRKLMIQGRSLGKSQYIGKLYDRLIEIENKLKKLGAK